MKSVLISIQPYYVFLIIARQIGWNVPEEKTVEVRKTYPTSDDWDRKVIIYCSRNMKSFNRIPKEYQPLMRPLLGKVIGEFICEEIECIDEHEVFNANALEKYACITMEELFNYTKGKTFYCWHISDLIIYDKPKELSEFRKPCPYGEDTSCFMCDKSGYATDMHIDCFNNLTRPPQSWCYVEEA